MTDDLDPWRTFWLAGELSEATGTGFAARIHDFEPPGTAPPRCTFASAAVPLSRPDDALARLTAARSSGRSFGEAPVTGRALGSLFSAFADAPEDPDCASPTRRRAWPSAGGLYPVEVFGLLLAVEHPLAGRVVHYEPDVHALTDVGAAPAWAELHGLVSSPPLSGEPQLLVLFTLDTPAMEAKYGNRAGRFALVEVGHCAQSLALRLAADGLVGCELGGTHDRALLELLGLAGTPVRLALAYACGTPPAGTERRRPLGRGAPPWRRR